MEARHRLLQGVQPTGAEVVKAAAYLAPKGVREQEHAVRKAERDKYLSRVGQLGRLWPGLDCSNPSCVFMDLFYAEAWYYRAYGVISAYGFFAWGRHRTPTTRLDRGTQRKGLPKDEPAATRDDGITYTGRPAW